MPSGWKSSLRLAALCAALLPAACADTSPSPDRGAKGDPHATPAGRDDATMRDAARNAEPTSGPDASRTRVGLQAEPMPDASLPPAISDDGGRLAEPPSAPDAAPQDAGAHETSSPLPSAGEPLQAPADAWTYVEFPSTQCRDGSPAGLVLSRKSSSKKLMIFLEGGGVCQDPQTCLINPANTADQRAEQRDGVFDRTNARNPVKDWNIVYVPYCTGDMHAGANAKGMVANVGPQKFVGYLNMQKFLERLVPTFPGLTDVLLTGVSAGGFGASQSAPLVQRAFPGVKVRLVSDSSPPLSSAVVPSCLQDIYRTDWALEETYLAECGDACPNKSDFLQDYAVYLAKAFADRPSGMIESVRDGTVADYFGIGRNSCTGVLYLTPVPGDAFQAALLALRDALAPYPSFGTYFPGGTQHMWLNDPSFYTGSAGGTMLVDWFGKVANDHVAGNAGP